MKLLFVTNGFPPRGRFGTEFYSRELVRGLLARGHDVLVLHPLRDGERPRYTLERVEEDGVSLALLSNAGDPRKGFRASYRDERVEECFAELLAQERPDVVHALYLGWGLSYGLPRVATQAGVPCLATLTDYGAFCHRGQMFDHRLERCEGPHPPAICARCIREPAPFDLPPRGLAWKRMAVRLAAALGGGGRVVMPADVAAREEAVAEAIEHLAHCIAPTASLARVAERGGVPAEKLSVLPYAFDTSAYDEVARTEPDREGPFRFGFFGQLAPHKGVAVLFEALRRLAREMPTDAYELVLHGAPSVGRHGAFGDALLADGLPPGARFGSPFGPQEAPRVLSALGALVVPSLWDENAPLACLQARAAGVPLIASDVSGIAEIVGPEEGALFPPGDAAALAKLLEASVRSGPHRTGSGLPVSYEAHLDRVEALYRSVR